MAQVNLSNEEAHLIAMYRAIKQVDHFTVGQDDVGGLLELLKSVLDPAKAAEELTQKEVKQLLRGFVSGIAAVRLEQFNHEVYSLGPTAVGGIEDDDDELEHLPGDTIIGGSQSNPVFARELPGHPEYVESAPVATEEG